MADKKGEERSRLAGYEVGFSGSRPDGLSLICAEGTYVEGQRQGYADYLKNKDLAERIAAGAKASVVKTEERSSTAGVTERVVEVESSREREENEERRHRELLDAVEDHDDGEDYEEEDALIYFGASRTDAAHRLLYIKYVTLWLRIHSLLFGRSA